MHTGSSLPNHPNGSFGLSKKGLRYTVVHFGPFLSHVFSAVFDTFPDVLETFLVEIMRQKMSKKGHCEQPDSIQDQGLRLPGFF